MLLFGGRVGGRRAVGAGNWGGSGVESGRAERDAGRRPVPELVTVPGLRSPESGQGEFGL